MRRKVEYLKKKLKNVGFSIFITEICEWGLSNAFKYISEAYPNQRLFQRFNNGDTEKKKTGRISNASKTWEEFRRKLCAVLLETENCWTAFVCPWTVFWKAKMKGIFTFYIRTEDETWIHSRNMSEKSG